MLGPIKIRLTKTTRGLDGKPLVDQPPRSNKIVYISMSDEDKDFYEEQSRIARSNYNNVYTEESFKISFYDKFN
jgi:DNA repair protein RAD5